MIMRNRAVCTLVATAVAAALALAGGPANATEAAPTDEDGATAACRIRKLPTPAGAVWAEVSAGDPSGRILAGMITDADGNRDIVGWTDRVPTVLDLPVFDFRITSVSRNGTIGGYDTWAPSHGLLITPDGVMHELTGPEGGGYVHGVADDGSAAGTVLVDLIDRPAVWRAGSYGDPELLPVPGGRPGQLVGMAPDGTLVMNVSGDDLPGRAFQWTPAGERQRLTGTSSAVEVGVHAVANGWAAGEELNPETGKKQVLRWRTSDGQVTPIAGPGEFHGMFVEAVNRRGVIGGQIVEGAAALIKGLEIIELPALSSEGGHVYAVANNGRAAGVSWNTEGQARAVTWRCG